MFDDIITDLKNECLSGDWREASKAARLLTIVSALKDVHEKVFPVPQMKPVTVEYVSIQATSNVDPLNPGLAPVI